MKFNKNLLKEKWFSYTFAMCSAVVLYLVLTHITGILQILKSFWHVCSPVIMAFVIAYVLDPLVNLYSKYVLYKVEQDKLRHTVAVVLSFLTVILFITVLAVALIPQVIDSIVMFAGNLNGYVLSFQKLMQRLNSLAIQHDIDLSQFISSSDELLQSITRVLPENLNKIVNASYSFGAKMFEWGISFILAIYLMIDKSRLRDGLSRLLHALLPPHMYQSTSSFWKRCNKILVQYIAFDVLDGMIIGVCNWVFMVLMRMPYVAIISVIVGVTNLAPTFGPMAGAIIGAFILVLVNPWHALWFLLFTLVLQTLDGYVIKPRLFGEQLGVSSVWILIALVIGGRLLGVPGILLAIPFAAIADFVYHDYFIKRLELKNEEQRRIKEAADAGMTAAAGFVAESARDAVNKTVAGGIDGTGIKANPSASDDRGADSDNRSDNVSETASDDGFEADSDNQHKTGSDDEFEANSDNQYKTGSDDGFETDSDNQHKTGSDIGFETDSDNEYKTGSDDRSQTTCGIDPGTDSEAAPESDTPAPGHKAAADQ